MIITVTVSPSRDRTIETPALLTLVQGAAASVALPGSSVPTTAQVALRHPDLITDFDGRALSIPT